MSKVQKHECSANGTGDKEMTQEREKKKLFWLTPDIDLVGNAYGYATHNRYMRKHCSEYFEYTLEAPIALQIVPADKFVPVPGKINVLFTMWELLDVPQSYKDNLKKADIIIVPSAFCRDIFKPIVPDKPIYVCHEGVDPAIYKYKPKMLPSKSENRRFRFLWVGAPNPRKGYPFILEIVKIIEKSPDCELYIKTTMPKMNWGQTIRNAWRKRRDIFFDQGNDGKIVRRSLWRAIKRIPKPYMADRISYFGKQKNIIFDTRKLTTEELVGLYHSSHCFLFPTYGEGWGLTLTEAMACGCPCIATEVTGCKDFFDEKVGYPINHIIVEQELTNYDLKNAKGYCPDMDDFVKKIMHVLNHYPEALKKGKKASEKIAEKFTWDRAAKRLYDIIGTVEIMSEVFSEGEKQCVAK